MSSKDKYYGIDIFRIVASCFIIAIHVSPFSSYSNSLDFIFTRIICRVGVPFFFMATGFFVLGKLSTDETFNKFKVLNFLRKTFKLYIVSIVLYLPTNFYMGYFNKDNPIPSIIKDILFNGTLYHLWYLPSVILGVMILFLLFKLFNNNVILFVTILLYTIGLLGDSYYGLTKGIPFISAFYNKIFMVFDYTRNGLFFAPIFIMMGAIIRKNYKVFSIKKCLFGLCISLIMLLFEGITLHNLSLQKHDSMYIMLPIVMLFLFQTLLHLRKNSSKSLRNISLIVYIIHPLVILYLRVVGKIFNVQNLIIYNSIINYFLVMIFSIIFAFAFLKILKYFNKLKTKKHTPKKDRAWTEINLNNLVHNVEEIKKLIPKNCKFMAVVKANAYGHGDIQICKVLNSIGVTSFAVATIDEAIHLRKNKIFGEILILGYTSPERAKELKKYNLIQTVVSEHHGEILNKQNLSLSVHVKINTGMNRLGEHHINIENIVKIFNYKNLDIQGIYTHLSSSDSLEEKCVNHTKIQINNFYNLLNNLKSYGIKIPKTHIQSSYGLLNYPNIKCDYVRIGIALYGALSNNNETILKIPLAQVMEVKARIILIQNISKGECVGYGFNYITEKDMKIGIVSIGYADGIPRNLSCKNGYTLINNIYCPIIGSVCMDQLLIDISDIKDVKQNDIVTIMGKNEHNQISPAQISDWSDTISNEFLSRLGERLKQIYC